ncbi:MAG: RNA polymerase factor sigma-54 [Armatimonadetes bacterium]|nr:RNA polymerase factor sigma-54 [Armatimonadota bacterium]
MPMAQRYAQSQRMQQKADPQLLMTNRILQMSAMELRQYVVQELAENPALEQPEELPCNRCEVPISQCLECPYYLPQFRPASVHERDELRSASAGAARDDEPDPLAMVEDPVTLQDHLLTQLHAVGLPEDYRCGAYLIAGIDDDGYLRVSVEEAAADLDLPIERVVWVLALIQTFEPAGVGARSLQECLLIQIRALRAERPVPPLVERILERHWKELCANKLRVMARALRTPLEEVQAAVQFIRHQLSPYPGSNFRPPWDKSSHRSGQAVRPDAVVRRDASGNLAVEVIDGELPQVHLNPRYLRMWQAMRERPHAFTSAERRHVQEYITRAQMFLKSIQDRKNILRQVVDAVLEEQCRFFQTEREEDMTPLTQSQLAGLLRVHESTISRTVAEKFLQLPSGRVVPVSYFFDRSMSLRRLVANLVAAENPAHPYSDQQISEILRRMGIVVARRTVMKYREDLNILSSRQRMRA